MKRHINDFTGFSLNEDETSLNSDQTEIAGYSLEELGLTPQDMETPILYASFIKRRGEPEEMQFASRDINAVANSFSAFFEDLYNPKYPDERSPKRNPDKTYRNSDFWMPNYYIRAVQFDEFIRSEGPQEFKEAMRTWSHWSKGPEKRRR